MVDFWALDLRGVCSQIRGEQLFVRLEGQDQELLSVSYVLPLNQMLDHLCVEHQLNSPSVHLVLVFAAREHVSDHIQVLNSPFSCRFEITLPSFPVFAEVFILLFYLALHQTNLPLVDLQARSELLHRGVIRIDSTQ